jgi:PTH2 family peptidyl-tRNA hydrolase
MNELDYDRTHHIKMVIAMRRDLNMRRGKQIAQGAHAAMKIFLDRMKIEEDPLHKDKYIIHISDIDEATKFWITGAFTKVVVGVDDEEGIYDLAKRATELGIPHAVIVDSGFTEFRGNKTTTCIAIGPAEAEKIDPITRHLVLI